MSSTIFISTGSSNAANVLLLAHGAGAGMDSPFMSSIAEAISEQGICVHRFEFLYMQKAKELGKRRPPDSAKKLQQHFLARIEHIRAQLNPGQRLWVGGKSMGGRIASMITATAELEVEGCVCLGYPFHPPGRPEKLRTAHFVELVKPTLIIQGTRDPFGKPEENVEEHLSKDMTLMWLEGGDHSLKARKKDPVSTAELWAQAAISVAEFIGANG